MAQYRPPAGGICYYGHSRDVGNDYGDAVALITGNSGNIECEYSGGLTLRYNWMDANTGIARFSIDISTGAAYSVYQSDTGDVFAYFANSSAGQSAPMFSYSDVGTYKAYRWDNGTAGIIINGQGAEYASPLYLFKFATTDVLGGSEKVMYSIPIESRGLVLYPDSVSSGSASGTNNIPTAAVQSAKFTVLGPIYSSKASSVTTYARYVHGYTVSSSGSMTGGSYDIGDYNFQLISGSHGPIALKNN